MSEEGRGETKGRFLPDSGLLAACIILCWPPPSEARMCIREIGVQFGTGVLRVMNACCETHSAPTELMDSVRSPASLDEISAPITRSINGDDLPPDVLSASRAPARAH